MNSDTPETDAFDDATSKASTSIDVDYGNCLDFARKLERERNELRDAVDRMFAEIKANETKL